MPVPATLFEKLWCRHLVRAPTDNQPAILYIDLHLLNEVTSPQAFSVLTEQKLKTRRPDRTLATLDHATPTLPPDEHGRRPYVTRAAEEQVMALVANAAEHGICLFDWADTRRGIVHVIAPELGLTLPGMTIVCGDSHTSTHGAFGCLAFGIGTSEVAHVLATQCLLQQKPRTMRVNCLGDMQQGASAKDLGLALLAHIGAAGATGHVIEYSGAAISKLTMEERMTLCNLSIECGARAGMIAPDVITIEWLRGRPDLPPDFDARFPEWLTLRSDPEARFDREIDLDVTTVSPMVTWGTTPDSGIAVGDNVPEAPSESDIAAMDYMGLSPGQSLAGLAVDLVFIGSCTNGRLSDLREAARILSGRHIAPGVTMLIVPGSESVRRAAEAEGLDRIFTEAGGEWRLSGCSMCLGMNGDLVPPGKRAIATSNRNFIGRQGPGARTMLASPATAAASAVRGAICDPRSFDDARSI